MSIRETAVRQTGLRGSAEWSSLEASFAVRVEEDASMGKGGGGNFIKSTMA